MPKKVTGSVVVVGGGIAGVQAATDLADSGYLVHLIEKTPSIGGTMAQLDKTFPTNDCSMCIMSPKLVECGRHLNINIHTLSEITDVSGEPGNFTVKVHKKARFVNQESCTGCGECFEVCPVRVPNDFDQGLAQRRAIYRPFPQAFPNVAAIEKKAKPCQITCPAGVHAQGYVALISQGKYKEALAIERKDNPLPAICGRICNHPCESECRRGLLDEPVSIQYLKRFIADWEVSHNEKWEPELKPKKKEKIAIIGGGPAGVSCASYLALEGYSSTIFDALPTLGGMLKVGIPAYRLPKEVLDAEIKSVTDLGVDVKLNSKLGKDISLKQLFKQGFKAVFIAIGAHQAMPLRIQGENAQGVLSGVDFLRELNLKKKAKIGKKVVVIGGGNVAIDAARSSLRLGAEKVKILYRRSAKEMPANPWEIEEAAHEGIEFEYLVSPVEIIQKNNKAVGIKCIQNRLGPPDASGRRRPVPVSGSEYIIDCDTVISAIGQKPDSGCLEEAGLKVIKGIVLTDPDTLATSEKGVFAGGDAVLGPATAVEAIAHGKKAAQSIIAFIKGKKIKMNLPRQIDINYGDIPWDKKFENRKPVKMLPVNERVKTFEETELGYTEKMAIAEAERCLACGVCSECMECEKTCKALAIDHSQQDEILNINTGAVIFTPGFDEYDPSLYYKYGYKKYPDVVTSIEFERILSASGPFGGEVIRLSDMKTHPKKIAFFQCVGSRDEKQDLGYCSAVCCMYAIKEAIIAKEHAGKDLDITIFYMDMRCYGKGFDAYYERAINQYNIKFVRSKIYNVSENKEKKLSVRYCAENGEINIDSFDMIVLSVGIQASQSVKKLAEQIDLRINKYGFLDSLDYRPTRTIREGIFSSGTINAPKDIPESVTEASTAVGYVNELLYSARNTLAKVKKYPNEIDITYQAIRIGVFICHCGINIGGFIDIPKVKEFVETLPNVVFVDANLYTCSQDTQEKMKEIIHDQNLTRVIVASCTPQTHEPLFQETIKEAGLNKYLFEMANIRDQCSWVHMHEKENATEKAKDLVKMAIYKANHLNPLYEQEIPVNKSAMIIGGGVSGMNAALNLAGQEYQVYLIEKSDKLGGMTSRIKYRLDGSDVQKYLSDLISSVKKNPHIKIIYNSEVHNVSGFIGNFHTTLINTDKKISILEHGVFIVAVGGSEYKSNEYLYSKNKNVVTQLEIEDTLSNNPKVLSKVKSVVMIQCVGSREPGRMFCSRFCCQQAVKNALLLKKHNSEIEVTILYRDMRTYGLTEEYYRKARQAGIVFVHYEPDSKPVVKADPQKNLTIEFFDSIAGTNVKLKPDKLVLSVGMQPHINNDKLASNLKVPINKDNFFLEAHVKLNPVSFATEGIYLAGSCHSPKTVTEAISQTIAASGKAAVVLNKDHLTSEGMVSKVDDLRCNACGMCVKVCPYKAIEMKEKQVGRQTLEVAVVNEVLCKGCGLCSSTCPSSAIDLKGFSNAAVLEQIKAGVNE